MDFARKLFWKFAYFSYPYLRDFLLISRILHHSGRQPYTIGRLKKDVAGKCLEEHLLDAEYEHNILAWIDDDEIMSMRKRACKSHQYHIRLYSDGEIRGHYEIAPEYAPLHHFHCEVFERKEYFRELLRKVLE